MNRPLESSRLTPRPTGAGEAALADGLLTSPLPQPASRAGLLPGFWMGGFESACHLNSRRCRVDMIAATQHDRQVEADYARLKRLNIHAARDGVRWHRIERRPGRYDFTSLLPMVRAARRQQVRIVWNLCHYGWPDDLDLFAADFVDRFRRFARATAQVICEQSDAPGLYAPMNEISFLTWAIGCEGFIHPYSVGRCGEIKRQLVRAALEACAAIREVDPLARFVYPEPLIRILPPADRPELAELAARRHQAQFEAWDMIAGCLAPELGGDERYLDILGLNYYHANQFEHPDCRLRWEDEPRDPRWRPLHQLLAEVHERYRRPMIITETSHFGEGRARWLREIAQETQAARAMGLPLEGLCLYPVIDRPDWENADHWHNSGLWDIACDGDGKLCRVLNHAYAHALRHAQQQVSGSSPEG